MCTYFIADIYCEIFILDSDVFVMPTSFSLFIVKKNKKKKVKKRERTQT